MRQLKIHTNNIKIRFKIVVVDKPWPRQLLNSATWPDSRYKSNLSCADDMEGIVMKQYAAQALTNAPVFLVW